MILQDFQKRWQNGYLTLLREFHTRSGNTHQVIKKGDVVIIHDNTPRTMWKIAVVNHLVMGGDGLARATTLCTANGTTNRPVTKLYPRTQQE